MRDDLQGQTEPIKLSHSLSQEERPDDEIHIFAYFSLHFPLLVEHSQPIN